MQGIVLCFSGAIASGKTTISVNLAKHLGCPRVSFGDYVRKVTLARGLDISSIDVLQNVGESLIKEGCRKFCSSVLEQINWEPGQTLVVDGIRHKEALVKLKELTAPSRVFLIYITSSQVVQDKRLKEKGISSQQMESIERHSTEKDVKSELPAMADITVDGSKTADENVQDIITFLNTID
ncbi:MAG: AAA family ATPase [Candidatus Scalindua sediminis]|nr:AAA family ATPase [Candidatus Scalindua sediminis]